MNRDMLLVAVAAAAFVGGCALAWSGLHVTPTVVVQRRPTTVPLLAGAATGLAVLAATGWPVPAVVLAVLAGWAARRRHAGADGRPSGPARTEALATWVEGVRDVLQAAGQPIGAIGASVATCPAGLRADVGALHARLAAGQPPEAVFRRFADAVDDPLADLVAVGMLIAVTRGAQTEQVLSALAAQARHQADRRRIVEAERAPMRREVQMVSLVMCALLVGLFAFARSSYLAAYDAGRGQLFLGWVLCAYAALLVKVARLSRFPKAARFLTLEVGR